MPDKNEVLKNMNIFFSAMKDDHIGKADVAEHIKKIIAYVKKIDERTIRDVRIIKQSLEAFNAKLKNDNNTNVSELKDSTKNYVSGVIAKLEIEHSKLKEMVDNKLAEVKDGEDADEERILDNLKAQIHLPTIDELEDDLPKLGTKIRDSLELLNGEDRLDVSAIKGLKELIKGSTSKVSGGGLNMGAVTIRTVDNELLGTGDNSETDFTLNHAPSPATSLHIKVGTAELFLTDDFTLSGKVVTFLTAPPTGAKVRADYKL